MARKDSFGLAKQAAQGTSQTVMEQFPPVEKVSIKDNTTKIESDETLGVRAASPAERGVKGFELTAAGSARPQSLPKVLAPILGVPVKTNPYLGQATAYSYMFDPLATDPVYYSLLASMRDPKPNAISGLFWDAIGSKIKLAAEPNGYLTFEATYYALDYTAQAAPVATYDVTKRWTFDQIKCYLSVDGGGEVEQKVSAWSLEYDLGLDTDNAILGTRKLLSAEPGDHSCVVAFTPKDSLDVHFARALQDDPSSVKVRLAATGGVIAGAVNYLVEAIAYLVQYDEAPAGIDAKSRLNAIPIKGTAYYDSASGKLATVQVVNATNNAA
jgi:hypothetical protein